MTPGAAGVRVGVLLDGLLVPAWAAWVVNAIRGHAELELALVVVCDWGRPKRASILFSLYEALDRRIFRRPPDALERVDLVPALDDVPQLRAPLLSGDADRGCLRGEDVAAVRRSSLDVIVDLGATRPRGGILSATRHGVWSLHQGDPVRYRGEPALFWEMFNAEPTASSVLEMAAEGSAAGAPIYSSVTATNHLSLQRSRNSSYWKGARFFLRRLEDLAAARWKPDPEPASAPATKRVAPSNTDALRHVARVARHGSRTALRNIAFREQWFLGFRERRSDTLPYEDPRRWTVTLPPGDRFWADPFVFEDGAETLVFCEQMRWALNKGELVVGRLEEDCRLTDLETILPAAHHLSYPYVFRAPGGVFMVPESAEAGRVELWTATDFPLGWELVGPLLEGVAAVDASILRHDGLYWLWVNLAVPGGRRDDEASLYFSERLESGWKPHPRNPVVSDARRARSAGRPFLHGGTVIRPAQDCTGRYGGRVVFNEVELLTTEDYAERPAGSLTAAWAPDRSLGAHTYTFDGRWEATDGQRLIRRRRR